MKGLLCLIGLLAMITRAEAADGLAIQISESGKRYLVYNGKPLLAFGPGDEKMLISINNPSEVRRWAKWQKENGMCLIRTYPTCVPTPGCLHPFKSKNGKWNIDAWNDEYFKNMERFFSILEEYGIVVHLQLWQIVWFKEDKPDRWAMNYINPANNINEWTRAYPRGADYMNAPPDSPAGRHRKEWVIRILKAVKGHKNVWIDVINELGNGGIGDMKWAHDVVSWIREWERTNGQKLLVGVDMCNFNASAFEPFEKDYDLLIFNELHRDEALQASKRFNKPMVSVRSSDGSNNREDYLFIDAESTSPQHQTRYRTLCYRSIFSGLQSIGAYWKSEIQGVNYTDMKDWAQYARALRRFWGKISHAWPNLKVDDSIVSKAITPFAYGMKSNQLYAVYLECGPHTAGNHYQSSPLEIKCPFVNYHVELFDTKKGVSQRASSSRSKDKIIIQLPEFVDDIVVLIWQTRSKG